MDSITAILSYKVCHLCGKLTGDTYICEECTAYAENQLNEET